MSDRRTVTPPQAAPGGEKNGGFQLPGWMDKLKSKAAVLVGGCLIVVFGCALLFGGATWWGVSRVTAHKAPAAPVMRSVGVHDPLGCRQRGLWVVRNGNRYSCTAPW
jgi:hypothetical protein